MKGDVKGYGNPRSKDAVGCYQRCGKLTLTAQCETDAALLAMLAQVMFPVGPETDKESRLSLWRYLRRQMKCKTSFPKV
jgi:hypothetical protein